MGEKTILRMYQNNMFSDLPAEMNTTDIYKMIGCLENKTNTIKRS